MTKPTRGQVWKFSDGREGVIASYNTIGVGVYVGPQHLTVPAGDVDLVFDRATLVSLPGATLPIIDPVPPATAAAAADHLNISVAGGAGPVHFESAPVASPVAATGVAAIVPSASGRRGNRKRQAEVERTGGA